MLIDEGDISNYLEVNIKTNPDGTFKWSQSHTVEKVTNHARLEVSASLKSRETPDGKYESSIGIKCVWNCRVAVGMLSYLKGSTRPEISMAVHQCARFCNNPRLVHEHAIRQITNYLTSTSNYVYLLYINWHLTTNGVVYKTDIVKCIKC